jgi:hypothetical protein
MVSKSTKERKEKEKKKKDSEKDKSEKKEKSLDQELLEVKEEIKKISIKNNKIIPFSEEESFQGLSFETDFKSNVSLEQIGTPIRNPFRIEGGVFIPNSVQEESQKKDTIKYMNVGSTDMKYEHYDVATPERGLLEPRVKTPEDLLDEQIKTHNRVFQPTNELAKERKNRESERGYFATPDIRSKKEMDIIRKDYNTKML